jgi:hypothetical protein
LAYPFGGTSYGVFPKPRPFAQKCDVPFAALAHPKSNQNLKKNKKDP